MKLVIRYIRRHIGIFLLSLFFLTMEAVADLMQPTFMSYIVDDGVQNADVSRILFYGVIMLGIAAVGAVSAVMRNIFASRTSQTIGKEIRSDMYNNIHTLSLENIDRLQPASIITRITNDVTQVQDFINGIMRIMVKAPITCVGAIILIIIQTPKQAPVIGGILVLAGIWIFFTIRMGYPRFGIVQTKLDKLNGVTREFLSAVRVVKAFNAEDEETEKFTESSVNLAVANRDAMRIMAVFSPLINLTVNFGIVLLLWFSGGMDSAHIGRLMASVNYMGQVLFALNMISNIINNAVRAMASSERIEEVLNEKPVQEIPENPLFPVIKGEVRFDDVTFAYHDAGNDALRNVSFLVKEGETIGIIGPTGSGKSTLINLIPRFYDATKGGVYVDGCDVREIDSETLRSSIAVVPQKSLLFTGTIEENLRWGREDATFEEVKEAARIACADEFIEKSVDGYQTLLGQGGVNLSGGQKQRLSLARALLRKPRILILDDVTSALDAATEAKVLKGLADMDENTTLFLISQRISTVMRADHILCLDDGKIQGFGTHAELMNSSKTYRAIYDSQIGGSKDSNVQTGGGENGK